MRLRDKRIKERIDRGELVCVKKGWYKIFLHKNIYDEAVRRLGKFANGGWEMTDEKPWLLDFLK